MSTLSKIIVWPPEQMIDSILVILYSPVKLIEFILERINVNWSAIEAKQAMGEAITLAGVGELAKWVLLLTIIILIVFWVQVSVFKTCFKGISLFRPVRSLFCIILFFLILFFFYLIFAGAIYFFFNIYIPLENSLIT
jgi:hypothetical protein